MEPLPAALRDALPALQRSVYLNTGTNGPMSVACERAMTTRNKDELNEGRIGPGHYEKQLALRETARSTLARFVNGTAGQIALTQSTTAGILAVALDLPWEAGDEIVATDVEHSGGLLPGHVLSRRGVKTKLAKVGYHGGDIRSAIDAKLGDRTRLVVLSHVAYGTGAILELKSVADLCRTRGIPVLVDGAQSVGAIPVDIEALGVDYYAFSGQKWLLGPTGSGGLWVHPDRLAAPSQPHQVVSPLAEHEETGYWSGIRRFEVGTKVAPAVVEGLNASVEWLLDEVGTDRLFSRNRLLSSWTRSALSSVPGVEVISPPESGTLVCFRVNGCQPDEVVTELAAAGVFVRAIADTSSVRFSVAWFHTEDELDRAVKQVAAIAAGVR